MKRDKNYVLFGVIMGSLAGSLAALLFTPTSGKKLRKEIKNNLNDYVSQAKQQSQKILSDTKTMTTSWVDRAQEVFALSKKYASGTYDVPKDTVEREISKLRTAFNAALAAYREYESETEGKPRSQEEAMEENNPIFSEYEDETLPKYEGMGKRM